MVKLNSDHEGVSDATAPPSATRRSHRPFTGHVRQRRPHSSRPTSRQASLSERAVDLRKGGRLRILRSFIGDASWCGAAEAWREGCDGRCASHHVKRVTRAMLMRPSLLYDGALAGLRVDPGQSAAFSSSSFLTSMTAGSAGCGTIEKSSSRHMCSIGSSSGRNGRNRSTVPSRNRSANSSSLGYGAMARRAGPGLCTGAMRSRASRALVASAVAACKEQTYNVTAVVLIPRWRGESSCELVSENAKIRVSAAPRRQRKRAGNQFLTGQFPTHPNREFFAALQGIKSGEQGNSRPDHSSFLHRRKADPTARPYPLPGTLTSFGTVFTAL